MNRKRIESTCPSGIVEINKILGAQVRVKSLTMQNSCGWRYNTDKLFTVSDIKFRISIDGKCYTILTLDGVTDRTFKLTDLVFINLNDE